MRLRAAAAFYPTLPDQPLPVKFVFILLNTRENYDDETLGIGRTLGALFSDPVGLQTFRVVCKHDEKQFLGLP